MEFEIDGTIDLLDSRASNVHEEWPEWLRFGRDLLWPKWGEERKKNEEEEKMGKEAFCFP